MKTSKTIYLTLLICIGVLTINSCNKDNDCTEQTWYQDADGDGFGNFNVQQNSCTQPPGYVSDNTDCNDNDSSTYPGAYENTLDGSDNNCNGLIDEILCTVDSDCPSAFPYCTDQGNNIFICQ